MEINPTGVNPIFLLPEVMMNHIFSYASTADITQRIVLVCKMFQKIIDSQHQWKERTNRLYGKDKAEKFFLNTQNWKAAYILGPGCSISEWKTGIGHFIGKKVCPNKYIEKGEFQNYRLINGKKTWADGTVYKGEFENGELNGTGQKIYGTIFKGQFDNSMLTNGMSTPAGEGVFPPYRMSNGQGTITFPAGTIYKGQFKDGKLNGQGVIILPNGVIYESEFKDDKLHGQGKFSYCLIKR